MINPLLYDTMTPSGGRKYKTKIVTFLCHESINQPINFHTKYRVTDTLATFSLATPVKNQWMHKQNRAFADREKTFKLWGFQEVNSHLDRLKARSCKIWCRISSFTFSLDISWSRHFFPLFRNCSPYQALISIGKSYEKRGKRVRWGKPFQRQMRPTSQEKSRGAQQRQQREPWLPSWLQRSVSLFRDWSIPFPKHDWRDRASREVEIVQGLYTFSNI